MKTSNNYRTGKYLDNDRRQENFIDLEYWLLINHPSILDRYKKEMERY